MHPSELGYGGIVASEVSTGLADCETKEAFEILKEMEALAILESWQPKESKLQVFRLRDDCSHCQGFQFIYETPPVDYFIGMIPFSKYLKDLSDVVDDHSKEQSFDEAIQMLQLTLFRAKQCTLWEGDYNQVYVFTIPDVNCTWVKIGFVWKQNNNGTTFIASPVCLPWLNEYLQNYYLN